MRAGNGLWLASLLLGTGLLGTGLPGTGLLATGAAAQTVRPGAALPTREEVQRAPDVGTPPASGPRLRVTDAIERAPCPLADARFADVKVTLSAVTFNGLKGGIDASALAEAYAGFLGQEQPIAVVCEIRDRAATILRRRGLLAAIQIPAQRIEAGQVRFDVMFARLAAIRVRGNAGRSEERVAALLQPLTTEPVFNERDAERRLLLARDLPGFDVRLTLRPSDLPGDVIGDVTVIRTPVTVDANIQNFGSGDVGRWGGTLRVQLNGMTGMGDSTTFSLFNTADFREQHVLTGSHSFSLGSRGLAVTGSLAHAWTQPSTPGLDIDSRTLIGNLGLAYPLVRRLASTLRLSGGIDIVDQSIDLAGTRIATDRLRVPYLRIDGEAIAPDSVSGRDGLSAVTPRWRIGGSFELRQGTGLLGASDACAPGLCTTGGDTPSRPLGDPRALVLRAAVQAEYRPTARLTLALGARAQYAGGALLGFEQMSGGNYTIGRGYDPGAAIGDSGVGVAAEARFGRAFPPGPRRLFVQPYVFADALKVWNNLPAGSLLDTDRSLVSVGAGTRSGWGDIARIDTVLAVPTRNVTVQGPGGLQALLPPVRFLVTITTRLWPWRPN